MNPAIVPCATEADWHRERAKTLGASDVASLFGHGYKTKLQLWRLKKGLDQPEPPNAKMMLGLDLEDGIGRHYARMTGRKVVTPQEFFGHPGAFAVMLRHPSLPLSCTPDRIILDAEKGEPRDRLLQLKNYGTWAEEEWDETGEPPLGAQIQVQAELLASGIHLGALGCLIGRGELRAVDIDRHEAFQVTLAGEIRAFWASLETGVAPPPTAQDHETIKHAFPRSAPGLSVEYPNPEDLLTLARVKAEIAELEESEKALLAKIQGFAGPAETITHGGRKLATWKTSTRRDPPREAREYPVRTFRIDTAITKAAKASLPPRHEYPSLPITSA